MEVEPRERELLEAIWSRIPRLGSDVLGEPVTLSPVRTSIELPDLADMYVATLELDGPEGAHVFLAFDLECAIAFGGVLVMMQEKVIREKIARREMSEDDFDAMGECVNQLASAFNDALRESLSSEHHARFVEGVVSAPAALGAYADELMVCGRGKLGVAALHEGQFLVLVPRRIVTGEAAPIERSGAGLELSPEEAEAIRAAAREGFSGGEESITVLVAVARGRAEWEAMLAPAGIELSFARDVFETRRLAREGRAAVVIVDADTAPSGGLAAVASLRGAPEVRGPVLVAASEPTRTHLVACLAAGAASYLVKPIELAELQTRIEQLAPGRTPELPPEHSGGAEAPPPPSPGAAP